MKAHLEIQPPGQSPAPAVSATRAYVGWSAVAAAVVLACLFGSAQSASHRPQAGARPVGNPTWDSTVPPGSDVFVDTESGEVTWSAQ